MRDRGARAVDRDDARPYVDPRRGTEPQRARPRDCKARRSEAAALLRKRRSGEHPERLGTAPPFARAQIAARNAPIRSSPLASRARDVAYERRRWFSPAAPNAVPLSSATPASDRSRSARTSAESGTADTLGNA